ncbi:cupin domain-containing protein [Flavobacterium sp. J49]|uniref:cupin domain-containing protein n=1 Tax=Flavobacterium sp. J49 TaxID=2718534 RepID=UPI0015937E7D|nr:cupin domain-containing protein [Flavobacterium sp. J49]MBF6642061.1 cupin domain-containing protein [Flavobacterium sp. J49]NIC03309.1 cupin domain-containing protein [Flavobacterium sp. J49]
MLPKNTKNSEKNSTTGLPKSKTHIILEIVEYVPDTIVCKTIIKNIGGKLSAVAFDEGEKFCEKTTQYDTFVQIIDGEAEVTIGNKHCILHLGESIIIPINTAHCFKANNEFKMITTIIKHSLKRTALATKSS